MTIRTLDGKVALVTGGTRGIGRGVAEALLAEGAMVVVTGRSEGKGAQAILEMGAGDRAHYIRGDMSVQGECEAAVSGTVERYGSIAILVSNAGGGGDGAHVVDMTDEAWTTSQNLNVNHTFWCARAALRHMIPNGWGRIINMSSMYGKVPLPGVSHYITSKHAILGFTKSLAQEVGTQGITCNAICPGVVLTDVWTEQAPVAAAALGMELDDYIDMIVAGSAIKRANTVEEVAALAVLLCSPAGAGITGACLSVDGGSTPY